MSRSLFLAPTWMLARVTLRAEDPTIRAVQEACRSDWSCDSAAPFSAGARHPANPVHPHAAESARRLILRASVSVYRIDEVEIFCHRWIHAVDLNPPPHVPAITTHGHTPPHLREHDSDFAPLTVQLSTPRQHVPSILRGIRACVGALGLTSTTSGALAPHSHQRTQAYVDHDPALPPSTTPSSSSRSLAAEKEEQDPHSFLATSTSIRPAGSLRRPSWFSLRDPDDPSYLAQIPVGGGRSLGLRVVPRRLPTSVMSPVYSSQYRVRLDAYCVQMSKSTSTPPAWSSRRLLEPRRAAIGSPAGVGRVEARFSSGLRSRMERECERGYIRKEEGRAGWIVGAGGGRKGSVRGAGEEKRNVRAIPSVDHAAQFLDLRWAIEILWCCLGASR
ncbi:hypothetical protein C8R45DRAFT_1212455 [Mycena sanguinolenta]|nr:hypothetical protein C8R45DRAFT_1212455 [Mycena sanguinolenta]